MFEISVREEFAAAHHIVGYDGDCARPHGHNWKIEMRVVCSSLDTIGVGQDFRCLKSALREVIQPWDHQDLNTLDDFQKLNPTAENIARLCYQKLAPLMKTLEPSAALQSIRIFENDRCSVTYSEKAS